MNRISMASFFATLAKPVRQFSLFLVALLGVLWLSTENSMGQALPPSGQKTQNAQLDPDNEATNKELLEKSEFPISNLTNLPVQSNFQFNSGKSEVTVEVFKLQPVIPITLNQDWNLITRTIIPITNQPSEDPKSPSVFGLGDLNPAFYFSPSQSTKSLFGFGPIFTLPTGTDAQLTAGKWSAGPALGARITLGDFVAGFLVNNEWSFAGWGDKDVNTFTLQPTFSYNLSSGWYLTYSPTMTSDWESHPGNRWTVPVGGGLGKLLHVEKQPIQISVQAFDNVLHPSGTSDWSFRFQMQFLFPK